MISFIEDLKPWGDGTSVMLLVASLADWLPPIAATLSIIWVLIRIYETNTIQWIIFTWKMRRNGYEH